MEKTVEAFRTIGEVAVELDLPQHVLRFWETKFIQIRPVKRAGGRRYYRPEDVQLVAAIRTMLYSEGYTIKGVQRILKEQGVRAVLSPVARAESPTPLRDASAQTTAPRRAVTEPQAHPSQEHVQQEHVQQEHAAEDHSWQDSPPQERAPSWSGAPATLTRLSAQDRHRLEAVLAELTECGRLLA